MITAPLLAVERAGVYPVQAFRLLSWGGDVYVRGRLVRQKQSFGGISTTQQEQLLEEGAHVQGTGYVYHPNLMELNVDLRIGATQQQSKINQNSFQNNGRLLGYNISALILKEKPLSFRPYASLSESLLARDFANSVTLHDERQGVEFYTKGSFPASLLLENAKVREDSDLRSLDRQTRKLLFNISDQRSPDWLTRLTFESLDTSETSTFTTPGNAPVVEDLPDRSNDLNLSNLWRFGPGPEKHTLSGRVRALDRKGFFDDRILLAEEQLNLVHTPTFSSFYRALYNRDEAQGSLDRIVEGEAGVRKKLYQSLDLTGRVLARDEEIDTSLDRKWGGFIEAAYRKWNPLGLYTSNMLLGREFHTQQSLGGLRVVRDESVTLSGITFSRLSNPNVQPGTIVVTDTTNIITYVENVDYVLRTVGAFTEIARIVTGDIADGQTVLVDYVVPTARDSVFTTDFFTWNNRLAFDKVPVAVYANYRLRDDNLQSGQDAGNLDKQRDFVGGAELSYKRLTFIVEHEIRDQQLFPSSVSDRARASYIRPLTRNLDLSVGANAEHTLYSNSGQFPQPNGKDFQDTLGAFLQLTMKITAHALLRLNSDVLQTRGQQNSTLARNGLSLQWNYGKLDFSLEFRHETSKLEGNDGTQDTLMFTLKRAF